MRHGRPHRFVNHTYEWAQYIDDFRHRPTKDLARSLGRDDHRVGGGGVRAAPTAWFGQQVPDVPCSADHTYNQDKIQRQKEKRVKGFSMAAPKGRDGSDGGNGEGTQAMIVLLKKGKGRIHGSA